MLYDILLRSCVNTYFIILLSNLLDDNRYLLKFFLFVEVI